MESASIWNNPKLKVGGKVFWRDWYTKGVKHVVYLYHNNTLRQFDELRELYNLQRKDFWKFLKLRECLSGASPAGTRLRTQSSIFTTLKLFGELPHLAG